MIKQRTIGISLSAQGKGIHSGKEVMMTLLPAPENHGIVFRRMDLKGKRVEAHSAFVDEVTLSTCLEKDGAKISTVEHLLSALSAFGIDNMLVELDAFEVPIMDGSSSPFAFLIQAAGIVEQNAQKQFFVIKKPIKVQSGDSWAELVPHFGFKVSLEIDFEHQSIKDSGQKLTIDFAKESYLKEISRARTFGLYSEMEQLQNKGFALGASMENAVALGDSEVLNRDGVRYKNEFVKHKILDIVGDLYLLGHNIVGQYNGYKSGHKINDELLNALLSNKDAWEIRPFKEFEAPILFQSLFV